MVFLLGWMAWLIRAAAEEERRKRTAQAISDRADERWLRQKRVRSERR